MGSLFGSKCVLLELNGRGSQGAIRSTTALSSLFGLEQLEKIEGKTCQEINLRKKEIYREGDVLNKLP
jgi:hypothetical protein